MKLKKLDVLEKPYQIYAEVLESGAIDQFVNVMELEDVVQGALMADAHTGYVLPVGGVVATRDTIYPAFVGYDIGCGVCSVPTSLTKDDIWDRAGEIRDAIYKTVPVGFAQNDMAGQRRATQLLNTMKGPHTGVINKYYDNACKGLGTLGGGNHFIELGYDEDERVWITVHSGSRSLGHAVGSHYMKAAAPEDNGNFEDTYPLNIHTDLGRDYINDLNYCLAYALLSRHTMIKLVEGVLGQMFEGLQVEWSQLINRNHNHAEIKDGLWIHRKGATHAELGMMGVIPGNMRDGCFVVRGKGNPASLYSSSHGAGRIMSRAKAKKATDLDGLAEMMKGVPGASVREGVIDESPIAYKNIFEVMELQKDLVEVVHHLIPIVNVKG